MQLEPKITFAQFREEMQHRVMRYPLNSRPVKEAMRFAKRHDDPAFYRVASDKVHAQRQFQRELYGPSRMERIVDFFTLGSLREVVVTLLLVGGGVVGLDAAKRAISGDPDQEVYAHMDIDALADRLGLAIESTRISSVQSPTIDRKSRGQQQPRSDQEKPAGGLSDKDVARIAEAVIDLLAAKKTESEGPAGTADVAAVGQPSANSVDRVGEPANVGSAVAADGTTVEAVEPRGADSDDPSSLVSVSEDSARDPQ